MTEDIEPGVHVTDLARDPSLPCWAVRAAGRLMFTVHHVSERAALIHAASWAETLTMGGVPCRVVEVAMHTQCNHAVNPKPITLRAE